MKRVLIIFLAAFYLIIASGLTLSLHYCGGKLKAVSLFSNKEEGCCGNKKKSKGCCKDKTTVIKVKDNHQSSQIAKINPTGTKFINVVNTQLLFNFLQPNEVHVASNYHAPPVLYDNPLYLKHRVLII